MIPPLLTVEDVAERLAVDRSAVTKLIIGGHLAASDIAPPGSKYRKWRIRSEDLDDFLARRAFQPEPPRRRRRRAANDIIKFF